MIFIFFFISVVLAVILLMAHSILTRGGRITFNFFLFAFIWAFRKESALPFSGIAPYEFIVKNISPTLSVFTVILGWIFTFYISWYIAEAILKRTKFFKNRLFITLLSAMWVTASVAYAVESTGISMGWWKWKIYSTKFLDYLVPGYSYEAGGGWVDFFIYFMIAFLLIECSKFKNVVWKSIFCLIPIVCIWFLRQDLIARMVVIDSVIILAFLSPLKLIYGENRKLNIPGKILKAIHNIPLSMVIFMILITVSLDLLASKEPKLLFSKLPIILCVLFAIRKIPIIAPVLLSIFIFASFGKLAAPAFILAIFILILKIADDFITKKTYYKRNFYFMGVLILITIAHFVFSPYDLNLAFECLSKKDKVHISGEVRFDNYKNGIIKIAAFAQPFDLSSPAPAPPLIIARAEASKPGPFQISISKENKIIYLYAINIPKDVPFWMRAYFRHHFSSGSYKDNPLVLDSLKIDGVIINID